MNMLEFDQNYCYNQNVSGNEMNKQPETFNSRGLFSSGFHLPYNRDLLDRAREMRKSMTPAESKLWYEFLREFSYRVLRQRPIDNFIVDFYCPKLKLVIEIDGGSHFSENGIGYDAERTSILESYNLKVIRFSNNEVLNDFIEVCRRIGEISIQLSQ